MLLFSSALCRNLVSEQVSHLPIPMHQCSRELNYTYLHKILEIPPGSDVCIINDGQKNCEAIKSSLISLGFSQYQYCIYFPGGPAISPEVQYAITPGEARLAPSTIKYIIDIGNRNVDIATLCHIITTFGLPETILNQVTASFAGYVGNFMRYMRTEIGKLTAHSYDNSKLLDYLDSGICISEPDGTILHVNPAFCRLLCLEKTALVGRRLPELFKDWHYLLRMDQITDGIPLLIQNANDEWVDFYFSRSYTDSAKKTRYLFFASIRKAAPSGMPALVQKSPPTKMSDHDAAILRMFKKSPCFSGVVDQLILLAEAEVPLSSPWGSRAAPAPSCPLRLRGLPAFRRDLYLYQCCGRRRISGLLFCRYRRGNFYRPPGSGADAVPAPSLFTFKASNRRKPELAPYHLLRLRKSGQPRGIRAVPARAFLPFQCFCAEASKAA